MHWGCGACGESNPDRNRFCGNCGQRRRDAKARDDRRLITALFADISGFTSLADQVDTERLHEVIAPVVAVLVGVAEKYGGTLAKYAGDAVLVFFGAPVAQEDHATRALLCALDMHRALADALPRLPREAAGLELHIGVNTGRVIAGLFGSDIRTDYSILGDAVNVAQRLESIAPAGATYVGETTVALTGTDFDLEGLGPLTLKGKARPVNAWRLRAAIAAPASSVRSVSTLVGRDRELGLIRSIIDSRAGVVCLTAEAGGGKTRLTDEVSRVAAEGGTRWLDGRCISYGAGLAFWPFIDLLRRAYGISIDQDPNHAAQILAAGLDANGVGEVMPYFARLLGLPSPAGTEDLAVLTAEAFSRELRESFAAWLRGLANATPIVLAIEDVHWADAASIDLIRQLSDTARSSPIVLYLTGRPEASAILDQVSQSFADGRRLAVTLGPLDPQATAGIIQAITGQPPTDGLLSTVVERAGGNPFFIHELVRSLQDTGALDLTPSGWALRSQSDPAALPPTVEGVLGARIDRLPSAAVEVLQTASVIGGRIEHALLESVTEEIADLGGTLDRLVAGGFLDRAAAGDRSVLMFHHAIVVDVAYSRLLKGDRKRLHRRVAEAAEALYGSGDDTIDLLARHFYLADAGVKAVQYLEQAASRSERLFANEEAIVYLGQALELASRTERMATQATTLRLRLGQLEDRIGRSNAATALYREVLSATNDVAAWAGLASLARRSGDIEGCFQLVDEAIATADRGADVSPLWLERAAAFISSGRFPDAIDAAKAGLAAIAPPETATAGRILLQLTNAEVHLGLLEDARQHGEGALAIFEALGDIAGETVALRVLGTVHNEAGDVARAADVLKRGLELAQRTGSVDEIISCCVNLGQIELRRGALDEAVAATEWAIREASRVGHAVGLAFAQGNLAEMLWRRGDLAAAREACDIGMELATKAGMAAGLGDAQRTMAYIELDEGRVAAASDWAAKASTTYLEAGNLRMGVDCLTVAADAAERAGDAARASSLRQRALELERRGEPPN